MNPCRSGWIKNQRPSPYFNIELIFSSLSSIIQIHKISYSICIKGYMAKKILIGDISTMDVNSSHTPDWWEKKIKFSKRFESWFLWISRMCLGRVVWAAAPNGIRRKIFNSSSFINEFYYLSFVWLLIWFYVRWIPFIQSPSSSASVAWV